MRRLVLTAAALLLLGAAVTVAVAWGCALGIDVMRGAFTPGPEVRVGMESFRTGRFVCSGAAYSEQLRWGRSPGEYRVVDERGWPLKSLWAEYVGPSAPGALKVSGGLELTGLPPRLGAARGRTRYGHTFPVALPLRPRWTGLLVDTLLYATVLGVALGGAGASRRRLRGRRGRCTACGYDLRGAAREICPECGR